MGHARTKHREPVCEPETHRAHGKAPIMTEKQKPSQSRELFSFRKYFTSRDAT